MGVGTSDSPPSPTPASSSRFPDGPRGASAVRYPVSRRETDSSESTESTDTGGTTELGSSRETLDPISPSRQPSETDIAEVTTWLSSYRAGGVAPDTIPAQPKGLHRGGHVSQFVLDPDLARSARTYERHAYLRAPIPVRKKRLHALRRLDLPTSARTAPGLQEIVDLAASLLRREGEELHAFVSIMDDSSQTIVAASQGATISAGHTDAVAKSLCSHAILGKTTLAIPDLQADWRFQQNDYAIANLIRSYAGTPITVRADTDTAAVDRAGKGRASAKLEPVGALCIYAPSDTHQYTDEDLEILADCAELVGSAIEASYAINQRRREDAIRRSVCDLLALPLDAVDRSTNGSGSGAGWRASFDTEMEAQPSTQGGVNGQLGANLGTAFDAAAASLCEHLHADQCVILDPSPGHGIGSSVVLGRSHPFATRDWSNERVTALVEDIVEATTAGEALCLKASDSKLESRKAIVPSDAACLALPIRDLDGEPRLVVLAISRQPDIIFGKPERSYAMLIGQTLLGVLAVDKLLLSSSAAAAFVSQVSGELRLPLHVLTASLETLREQTPRDALPTLEPLLSTADTCCSSLRAVLEDVLAFNKIALNEIGHADRAEIDLAALVSDVCLVGSTRFIARDDIGDDDKPEIATQTTAPVVLEIEDRPPSDWIVEGSPAGMQRILLNLLSNAVKATPVDGTIHVRLSLAPPLTFKSPSQQPTQNQSVDQSSPLASARFAIADSGPGMSSAFIRSSLFEPFVQGDVEAQTAGAGLGASLARSIVKRLGGKISVTSSQAAQDHGTTMEVQVPVRLRRGQVDFAKGYAMRIVPLPLRLAATPASPSSSPA